MQTLAELSRQLAERKTTSRDLVERALAQIADPAGEGARTFLLVHGAEARAAADRVDAQRKAGATLSVHVKRAPHPTLRDAQVSIPASWRALETVDRGIVVALSLSRNLRGRALQAALDDAFAFVEQASVGDETTYRDGEGRTAARLRVIAPSTARRVELVADLIKEGADVNDKNHVSLECARNRARLCCCAAHACTRSPRTR